VATHSSGNHASCLSYAAMLRGIPCNVVMPRTAPQAKKDAVRGYGGVITECEPSTSSREATFAQVAGGDRRGFRASLQRPAGDRRAGHLFARVHRADRRPGHGGRADRWRRHDFGHLPDAVKSGARAKASMPPSRSRPTTPTAASRPGHIIADDAPKTVADGLKVPLKDLTWHFVKTHVTDILTTASEARDRRGDEADLAAPAGRDGAVQRGAAGRHPEEPRSSPASGSVSSSPAATSISTCCPGLKGTT
jgi:threonine dehydratase